MHGHVIEEGFIDGTPWFRSTKDGLWTGEFVLRCATFYDEFPRRKFHQGVRLYPVTVRGEMARELAGKLWAGDRVVIVGYLRQDKAQAPVSHTTIAEYARVDVIRAVSVKIDLSWREINPGLYARWIVDEDRALRQTGFIRMAFERRSVDKMRKLQLAKIEQELPEADDRDRRDKLDLSKFRTGNRFDRGQSDEAAVDKTLRIAARLERQMQQQEEQDRAKAAIEVDHIGVPGESKRHRSRSRGYLEDD